MIEVHSSVPRLLIQGAVCLTQMMTWEKSECALRWTILWCQYHEHEWVVLRCLRLVLYKLNELDSFGLFPQHTWCQPTKRWNLLKVVAKYVYNDTLHLIIVGYVNSGLRYFYIGNRPQETRPKTFQPTFFANAVLQRCWVLRLRNLVRQNIYFSLNEPPM